jgi:hypothetical protein
MPMNTVYSCMHCALSVLRRTTVVQVPNGAQTMPLAINESFMINTGQIEAPNPNEKRKRRMSMKEAGKAAENLKERASSTSPTKRSSMQRKTSAKDLSIIGAFPATYKFSLAARESKGIAVVNAAIQQAQEIGMPAGTGAIVVISSEAVKVCLQLQQYMRVCLMIMMVVVVVVCVTVCVCVCARAC